MRGWLVVVLLCGCNRIFGVGGVTERDARFFDAPADAASTCPTGQAPEFSPLLHQVFIGECGGYNIAAGRATCMCGTSVCEGPADGTPLPPIDLGLAGFNGYVDEPRLTPDGSELFLRQTDYNASMEGFYGYARQPDGSWRRNQDAPFAVAPPENTLGTIANGPTGLRAIVTTSDLAMHEWIRGPGGWSESRIVGQVPTSPTLIAPRVVDMTSDGLHASIATYDGAVYVERASLDADFEPGLQMPGVPSESLDTVLTDDCGRVYVTGLGGVFYVQRL